jgi:hypothetical protein
MNSAQIVHALTGMNTRKHPPRQISFASFSPPVDCVRQIAGSTQKNGSDSRAQGTLNADQVQKSPWHLAACQSAGNSDVQSANEAMTVLECQGIDRRFGGLAAVTGVDLRIDRGEIVGWFGPNGSGKPKGVVPQRVVERGLRRAGDLRREREALLVEVGHQLPPPAVDPLQVDMAADGPDPGIAHLLIHRVVLRAAHDFHHLRPVGRRRGAGCSRTRASHSGSLKTVNDDQRTQGIR